jgi:hypothetical protein
MSERVKNQQKRSVNQMANREEEGSHLAHHKDDYPPVRCRTLEAEIDVYCKPIYMHTHVASQNMTDFWQTHAHLRTSFDQEYRVKEQPTSVDCSSKRQGTTKI